MFCNHNALANFGKVGISLENQVLSTSMSITASAKLPISILISSIQNLSTRLSRISTEVSEVHLPASHFINRV
jgi:hypothetical protein